MSPDAPNHRRPGSLSGPPFFLIRRLAVLAPVARPHVRARALPFLADVFGAFGPSGTGLYRALSGPNLEVGPRLLHLLLPIAFGVGGDANGIQAEPHFRRTAPLGTEPVIGGSADIIAKAELRDGVCNPLKRR
jgi:hypothetical protein